MHHRRHRQKLILQASCHLFGIKEDIQHIIIDGGENIFSNAPCAEDALQNSHQPNPRNTMDDGSYHPNLLLLIGLTPLSYNLLNGRPPG